MTDRTWLVEIPRETCEALVDEAQIGRLGVVVGGRPEVFPVAHVVIDGDILFPTNVGTKMHAAIVWPWVAFEVDGVGSDWNSGWSVMARGRAEVITDPDIIERAASKRTSPWRTGDTVSWIRIAPIEITGRRIDAESRS